MYAERAGWMLERIQKLYCIEEEARLEKFDDDAHRQRYSVPILTEMKSWLDMQYPYVLPKSAIVKGVGYALGQRERLCRYTQAGCLELDNAWIENLIRPLALGRKNDLFAGYHEAAGRSAMIYSLAATAKKNDVEPFAYFKDIIARIADHFHKQVKLLLPPNWTPITHSNIFRWLKAFVR